jgi:hypothetical protein
MQLISNQKHIVQEISRRQKHVAHVQGWLAFSTRSSLLLLVVANYSFASLAHEEHKVDTHGFLAHTVQLLSTLTVVAGQSGHSTSFLTSSSDPPSPPSPPEDRKLKNP